MRLRRGMLRINDLAYLTCNLSYIPVLTRTMLVPAASSDCGSDCGHITTFYERLLTGRP